MDKVKTFVHNLGDEIVECMEKYSTHFDKSHVHKIAELCEDFCHITAFIKSWCDHHDGTLYHRDGVQDDRDTVIRRR